MAVGVSPVSASIRRMLEPIDASPSTIKGPTCAAVWVWVPPHSSAENWPILTSRTMSPYLSPKNARAPWRSSLLFRGDGRGDVPVFDEAVVGEGSISATSVGATAEKWEKSKRSLPDSTNEPA